MTAYCQNCNGLLAMLERERREHAQKLVNRERLIAERDAALAALASLARAEAELAALREQVESAKLGSVT